MVQLEHHAPPDVWSFRFVMARTEDSFEYPHVDCSSAFPLSWTLAGAVSTPHTVTLASGLPSA